MIYHQDSLSLVVVGLVAVSLMPASYSRGIHQHQHRVCQEMVILICNPLMSAVHSVLTLVTLIDHHLEAAVVVADNEGGRLRLRQAVLAVVPLE